MLDWLEKDDCNIYSYENKVCVHLGRDDGYKLVEHAARNNALNDYNLVLDNTNIYQTVQALYWHGLIPESSKGLVCLPKTLAGPALNAGFPLLYERPDDNNSKPLEYRNFKASPLVKSSFLRFIVCYAAVCCCGICCCSVRCGIC